MTDRIERLLKRVEEFHPGTAAELEEFRIKVLGRKGEFNELMDAFCSPDGLQAVWKVLDEKIKSTPDDESEKGKDQ